MSQHTPGPWKIAELPMDGRRRTVFSMTDEETAPAIAGGDTPEQRDANARLIAAAPELLWMLESLCRGRPSKKAFAWEHARALLGRVRA